MAMTAERALAIRERAREVGAWHAVSNRTAGTAEYELAKVKLAVLATKIAPDALALCDEVERLLSALATVTAELREAIYESDNGDGSGRLHELLVSLGGAAKEDGNS